MAIYIRFMDFVDLLALNEPGVQYQCDSCSCDLTHNIRIKCADPVCVPGEGVDLCPACFCAGKEFGKHQRGHAYRVIVCYVSVFAFDSDLTNVGTRRK